MIKITQIQPGVTEVLLNRPEKYNALSHDLMRAICQTFETLQGQIVILRGAGKVFCAGLDLNEVGKKETPSLFAKTLSTLYKSDCITIAAVHGAALAGGAGLMSACDFVIAEKGAAIGYPEVKRGIVPAMISGLLTRQVGARQVRELLLVGEPIELTKAVQIGLINEVTDSLETAAMSLAEKLLKGGPKTLSHTKRLIEEIYPGSFDEEIRQALTYHEKVAESQEAKEGILAFFEKREPHWVRK